MKAELGLRGPEPEVNECSLSYLSGKRGVCPRRSKKDVEGKIGTERGSKKKKLIKNKSLPITGVEPVASSYQEMLHY